MSFNFSSDPLIRQIQRRLRCDNLNYNIFVIGGNGTGKSWACQSIADMIEDGHFDISRVAFSTAELYEILEKANPGQCIIAEETGLLADNRNFQDDINKQLSYMQQTIRMKNLCIIYNLPSAKWADIRLRSLAHLQIEMKGVNRAIEKGIGTVKIIQYNFSLDKPYYHTPKIQREKLKLVTSIQIPKPPQRLIEPYEQKKRELVDRVLKEGHRIAIKQESIKNKLNDEEIVKYIKEHKGEFIDNMGKVSAGKIAIKFGIGRHRTDAIRQSLVPSRRVSST